MPKEVRYSRPGGQSAGRGGGAYPPAGGYPKAEFLDDRVGGEMVLFAKLFGEY